MLRQFPDQHASKHAAATGHPIIASFEPGEDWFYDYDKQGMIKGGELLSAAFPSKESARTRTRREGPSQLAVAPQLAPKCRMAKARDADVPSRGASS